MEEAFRVRSRPSGEALQSGGKEGVHPGVCHGWRDPNNKGEPPESTCTRVPTPTHIPRGGTPPTYAFHSPAHACPTDVHPQLHAPHLYADTLTANGQ